MIKMDKYDYGFILVVLFSFFQTWLISYLIHKNDFYFLFFVWIVSFGLSFICFLGLMIQDSLDYKGYENE
jgi:hypothetical protein